MLLTSLNLMAIPVWYSLPLFMPMSEEKLHLVSVMGAGLLLGVAFAVIVPEGIITLIKSFQIQSKHPSEGKYYSSLTI